MELIKANDSEVPIGELRPVGNQAAPFYSLGSSNPLERNTSNSSNPSQNPFIEANTSEVSLSCLKQDCIIPVFAKDNEKTIAHNEFIEIAQDCVKDIFPNEEISLPEIRVSHQIKGRIPSAIHKRAKDLLEHEKTQYWERMAFIIRVPSITEMVNGNELELVIGGVRAYNHENLYGKKNFEKFKVFIGFKNLICCNLCISTDGFKSEMRVGNYSELGTKISELIKSFDARIHLETMKGFSNQHLTEHQFAQLIGKMKLYHFLPKGQKSALPNVTFKDGQLNFVARNYYKNESFCRDDEGNLNLWKLYNLFTSAGKSSYIDSFIDSNVMAHTLTQGISHALTGNSNYQWFLS